MDAPERGGPPGPPNALHQQNNLVLLPGIAMVSQQSLELQNGINGLEAEAHRIQSIEISALKGRCKRMEVENAAAGRKWPVSHENLEKIPELERELRTAREKIEKLERECREQRETANATAQKLKENVGFREARLQEAGMNYGQTGKLGPDTGGTLPETTKSV